MTQVADEYTEEKFLADLAHWFGGFAWTRQETYEIGSKRFTADGVTPDGKSTAVACSRQPTSGRVIGMGVWAGPQRDWMHTALQATGVESLEKVREQFREQLAEKTSENMTTGMALGLDLASMVRGTVVRAGDAFSFIETLAEVVSNEEWNADLFTTLAGMLFSERGLGLDEKDFIRKEEEVP